MEKSISLYNITSDLSETLIQLSENDGELSDEIESKLSTIQAMLTVKTDDVCGWIASQDDLIKLADDRIKALQEFKQGINKRLDKFDLYVNTCLGALNVTKIEGTLYKISKRAPSKAVVISDETLIPLEFIKIPQVKPEIMKSEIAKALKSGKEVPGASLCFSENISISYKLK